MRVEPILQKLRNRVEAYLQDLGYSNKEIKYNSIFNIDFEDNRHSRYTDIYIYAEVSIEEFMLISDDLDEIVEQYDESSYFDVIEPGIYMARVYWSAAGFSKDKAVNVITPKNISKFGEYISFKLEDIYDEEFWIDEIMYDDKTQSLKIDVSSNNYSAKVSVKMYEEDVLNYQDMIDLYSNKVIRELEEAIDGTK